MRAGLMGVNAAVVGLLAAVLYDPIWTGANLDIFDIGCVILVFAILQWRIAPVWTVVAAGAVVGYLTGLL